MKTAYFILVASLIVALVSCKKSGTTDPPPEFANTCFDHVLKEPYLVYDGDQTGFAVIIQTTSYVHQIGGKAYITFGYDGNFGSEHNMAHHVFYEEHDCENYSIWRYRFKPGDLTINKKLNYIVHIKLPTKTNRYDGWFYTSADSHNDFSFYAFGDTRDGGDEYASCMNAIAYDMDHIGYYKGYRLLLHMGDFVYNGAWRRTLPSSQKWNLNFFGRNCHNNGGNRDKALFILSHVPVMGALGNHDFWWDGHTDENTARYYISNWPYKMYENSTGANLEDACNPSVVFQTAKCYYSFDYGIVHFI